jgi:hypothetical protein
VKSHLGDSTLKCGMENLTPLVIAKGMQLVTQRSPLIHI